MVGLGLLAVALAAAWLNRKALVREALTGWLRGRGIASETEVKAFGPTHFRARLRIGPADNPDFTAEDAEVGYRLTVHGIEVMSVRLQRPVLFLFNEGTHQRLYERLGYADWGHGTIVGTWQDHDHDGPPVTVSETCDVLALPLWAPWSKVGEMVDFLRAVAPTIAVPIHESQLLPPGRAIYLHHATNLAPEGTQIRDLAGAGATELL